MRYFCLFILLFWLCSFPASAQVYNHLYAVSRHYNDGQQTRYEGGYMNDSNRMVIDWSEGGGDEFINGRTRYSKKGKYGLIDTTGKWILAPIYDEMETWKTEPYYTAKVGLDSLIVFDLDGHLICQGYGRSVQHHKEINRIIFNNERGTHSVAATLFDYDGYRIASLKPASGSLHLEAIDQGHVYEPKNKKALMLSRPPEPTVALLDMQGNVLMDSVRTTLFDTDGQMVINSSGKACVVDTTLKEVIPFSAGYTQIQKMLHAPYFNVQKNEKWGFIDKNGHVTTDFIFDNYAQWHNDEIFILHNRVNGIYSYHNYTGKLLFESKELIQPSSLKQKIPVPVKKSENEYQLWKGEFIGDKYEYISPFTADGFAYCYDKGVKKIITTDCKVVFECRYNFLSLPKDNILVAGVKIDCPKCDTYRCALQEVALDGSYADLFFHIDMKGRKIINDTFERVAPFVNGLAQVTKYCDRYQVDKKGRRISQSDIVSKSGIASGVRVVAKGKSQQALADSSGKILSPWVSSFKLKEGTSHFYQVFEKNRSTNMVGTIEMLPDVSNGFIIFEQTGKYGLMDTTGHIVVPAAYTVLNYNYGCCYFVSANNDGQSEGVLNKQGKVVMPAVYERIEYHTPGILMLHKPGTSQPEVYRVIK